VPCGVRWEMSRAQVANEHISGGKHGDSECDISWCIEYASCMRMYSLVSSGSRGTSDHEF